MSHQDLESLGICSHCNKIISILDYAGSDGGEIWHCRHCGAVVDHTSFGFDKPDEDCKKVQWVGPEGKWVTTQPEEHFKIGEITIYVEPPRFAR